MRSIILAALALAMVGCGDDALSDKVGEPYIPDNGVYGFGVDIGRLGDECLGTFDALFEMEAVPRVSADLDAGDAAFDVMPRELLLCDPDVDDCSDVIVTGNEGDMLIYRQTFIGLGLAPHDGDIVFARGEIDAGDEIVDAGFLGDWLHFEFPPRGIDYARPMHVTASGTGSGDIAIMMHSSFDYIKPGCL